MLLLPFRILDCLPHVRRRHCLRASILKQTTKTETLLRLYFGILMVPFLQQFEYVGSLFLYGNLGSFAIIFNLAFLHSLTIFCNGRWTGNLSTDGQ